MKIRNRLIAILICVLLVSALAPAAFAEDPVSYGIFINGTEVTSGSLSNEWYVYSVENKTLKILKSIVYSGNENLKQGAIYITAESPLETIEFSDNATLINSATYDTESSAAAVYSLKGITIKSASGNSITGPSNLPNSYGIYVEGQLTIKGNGEESASLTVTGGTAAELSEGIEAKGLELFESAVVIANGGDAEKSTGACISGNGSETLPALYLRPGANFTATAKGRETSVGISCENGKLENKGTIMGTAGDASNSSVGISASSIVNTGSISGTAGESQVLYSYGIKCTSLENSSTLGAMAGACSAPAGESAGIKADSVTLTAGSVEATSGSATGASASSFAISASCSIPANSAVSVTANSDSDSTSYGAFSVLPTGFTVADIKIGEGDISAGVPFTAELNENAKVVLSNPRDVAVDSVSVSPASPTAIEPGKTLQLTATVLPELATNKNVSWSSDNAAVATVDENGLVTAVSKGSAEITATSQSDSNKAGKVTITVSGVDVTSVTITPSKTVYTGTDETISATVLPANASNKKVSWSVSGNEAGYVQITDNEDGSCTIRGLKAGSCVLTATSADNGSKKSSCTITVSDKKPVTGITITPSKTSLNGSGDFLYLTVSVTPTDASNKNVAFSTNNTDIVGISYKDNKVLVTAKKNGTATITATASDGYGATASISITVTGITTEIYKITNGTKVIYYYDKPETKTFYCTGDLSKFSYMTVNGITVESKYLTTRSSSDTSYKSIFSVDKSFFSAYFSNTAANYPVKIYYTDGSASGTIYIRSVYDYPLTGDSDMSLAYAAMLCSGIAILAAGFALRKKYNK